MKSSTHGNDFRIAKVNEWGTKFARKERKESGRRYARMSIGSASQRGPSQGSSIFNQNKRRRWFLRRGSIGSRGRRRTHNHENESERYDEDQR